MPFIFQIHIGAFLGRLMFYAARRRRHIAEVNIRLAFPSLNKQQQAKRVKENFRSTGIALIEVGLSWWGKEKKLLPLLRLEGQEHVHRALKKGKGIILLGGHFTCLIIAGRILTLQLPFNIVTKKAHNKLFEAFMQHYRAQQYQGLVDAKDVRGMLKVLKKNQILWYAPDQDFGRKTSVFVPFMGIQTATITATARLAKASQAAIIYIDFERLAGAEGYQLTLHPALADFPGGDDVVDATRINELIEKQVRKIPDQYLWIHRRFKTRPPGEPMLYGHADKKQKPRSPQ